MNNFKAVRTKYRFEKFLFLLKFFFEACFGSSTIAGEPGKSNIFFHGEILSGLSSVIHVGCLGNSHERHPLLGIGLAPITPFGAGLAGLDGSLFFVKEGFLLSG